MFKFTIVQIKVSKFTRVQIKVFRFTRVEIKMFMFKLINVQAHTCQEMLEILKNICIEDVHICGHTKFSTHCTRVLNLDLQL